MAQKNTRPVQKKPTGRNVPQETEQTRKVSTQGAVNWDEVLDTLASSGGGPFFFPKGTRTRMRLVCLEDDERHFYAGAMTQYKGRPKTKYVVFANVLASEGGPKGALDEKWKGVIAPVVITKTVLQGIINLLAEGYELFDETGGYGITILKSGSGTDTDYNVTPSPAPVKINLNTLELPEKSLVEYAEELTNRGNSRGSGDGSPSEGDW